MATSRAPEVQAIAGVFLVLTWISSCLRIYVKGFMAKSFAPEDWFAILSLILFTATAVLVLEGIRHSMGLHFAEVPEKNLIPAMQYWFAVEIAYVLTTCAIKISIAIFLLRIATKKHHRWILFTTIGGATFFTTAYLFFLIFQCHPVDYFWNVFAGEVGQCLAPSLVGAITYTHSSLSATVDVILSILPVIIVCQLQMNPRTKITVCVILGLGLFACIAVIIRIPYVKILVDDADDFLFASVDVVIWSAIEPGLAITAANMATLRPLFSAFLSRTKLWGTSTNNKSYGYGHSKNASAFSHRRGYVRSGSKSNTDEMGLQDMDMNGLTTTIETRDFGAIYGQKHAWGKDGGNTEDLVIQSNSSNEWPSGIRKTVRLDILSENGDDNYGNIVSSINGARGHRDRSQSGSSRSHQPGGSRDLDGLPRAHIRQESLGNGSSTMRRPVMGGSQNSFGPPGRNQDSPPPMSIGGRARRESPARGRDTRMKMSLASPIQTPGLSRADMEDQASVVSDPPMREWDQKLDSATSVRQTTRRADSRSRDQVNVGRRVSHIYQNSDGGSGAIRDWRGEL